MLPKKNRQPVKAPRSRHSGITKPPEKRALIVAKHRAGASINQLRKEFGYGKETIRAILSRDDIDEELVEIVTRREFKELAAIGGLARNHLLKKLADGKGSIIEATAVMDRSFQQRRLLAGQSTDNLALAIDGNLEQIKEARKLISDIKSSLVD